MSCCCCDATQGVSEQDAHIAGYILDSGRAVVLAVNKWDAVDSYQRETLKRSIEQRLAFLKFAPFASSRLKRQGLVRCGTMADAYVGHRKMTTPVLTRLIRKRWSTSSPERAGTRGPSCATPTRAGRTRPSWSSTAMRWTVSRGLQALPGRAHPPTTSWWARR
jgi:GTP-binding protein